MYMPLPPKVVCVLYKYKLNFVRMFSLFGFYFLYLKNFVIPDS